MPRTTLLALKEAQLCSNQSTEPEALLAYLEATLAADGNLEKKNKKVISMLTDLSLCLSQVQPMTSRFSSRVFQHPYEYSIFV